MAGTGCGLQGIDLAPGKKPPVDAGTTAARNPEGAPPHGKERNMGSALRSVYQTTVDESIPDDLLDLLGKLN